MNNQANQIVETFQNGNRKDAVNAVVKACEKNPAKGAVLVAYVTHYMPDDNLGVWLRLLEKETY
jgi:hypothetical protein